MVEDWFKPRGYRHFDAPVGQAFAKKACDTAFVAKHSWSPLIYYVKRTKRYKPNKRRTVYKDRRIMYSSHRDACILSKYSVDLTCALERYYEETGLTENVVAYRRLGKSNYDFSAAVERFAQANMPCVVLCFDITGFFDNLDHRILKNRLKRILDTSELSGDWYAVFRQVTQFRMVARNALAQHPSIGPRLKVRSLKPLATINEVKCADISIEENPKKCAIPQGTPISSALSNLYMMDVDKAVAGACRLRRAFYRRYSDDILIICRLEDEAEILSMFREQIATHRLQVNDEKTERMQFDQYRSGVFQYLGFNISAEGPVIRPSSLARQWRKLKRAIARTKAAGDAALAQGKAKKVFTKKLRKRFTPVGVRNFSSYARRAGDAFGSKKIVRQVLRLERAADKAICELND